MPPWDEIKQSLEIKIDHILQSQAKQLDAIVNLREDLRKIHELQEMKLRRLEAVEKNLAILKESLRSGPG